MMFCCPCRQEPIMAVLWKALSSSSLRQMQILTGKHWMEVWDPCRRVSRRIEGDGNPLGRPTVSTNLGTLLLFPLPPKVSPVTASFRPALFKAVRCHTIYWGGGAFACENARARIYSSVCLGGWKGALHWGLLDLSSSPIEQIILFWAITMNQGGPYQGSVHGCCAQSTISPAVQNMPQS